MLSAGTLRPHPSPGSRLGKGLLLLLSCRSPGIPKPRRLSVCGAFFCLFAFCFSLREEGGELAGNWTQVSWLRTGPSASTPTPRSSLPERPGLELRALPCARAPGSRLVGGVCVSVPSSPIRREGLGEGWSHSWLLSGPGGRGWVVMAMGIVCFLGGGGTGCLSTSRIRTLASAGHGEAPSVPDLPGGRGWTSVPRGHGASGGGAQGLEGSMSGARCPSDSRPGPTLSPGSILAHFQPPSFLSPGPSGALFPSGCVNHCLSVSFLSAPGAPGNMATWPRSEGSPVAGAAASAAGSCSFSPVEPGLGVQGRISEAGWATALCVSRTSDPCTFTPASSAQGRPGSSQALALTHLPCYLGK